MGFGTSEIVNDVDWLAARKKLLEAEKALTRHRDEVSKLRRDLPWREVDKDYLFMGENGKVTLSELFSNKQQLVVYHYMYGPDWQEGCKSCSFWADQYDAINKHLGARDARLAVISRAPLEVFLPFKARMDWHFDWYSSAGTTFNEDFNVSFPGQTQGIYNYSETRVMEELPGLSVFAQKEGKVYHTYSVYSRGLDALNATYQLLDLLPKGRDEQELPYPMAWIQLSDSYD